MRRLPVRAESGLWHGLAAYAIWGLLPVYFHSLGHVSAFELLGERILSSLLFVLALLATQGKLGEMTATFAQRKIAAALGASALLIGANWFSYMWAVTQGHVLAASLGYFLNPLVNVLIGVAVLGERLRRVQSIGIALAAAGVAVIALSAPTSLGLALSLALSFAAYGLVRKLTPVGALTGLAVETVLLAPLAIAMLLWTASQSPLVSMTDRWAALLLAASGAITSVPLILFATAARRLPMVTLGLIQYLTPSVLFLVGALVYREPMTATSWASFALIWSGIALFIADALRRQRLAQRQANSVASNRTGSPTA